MPTTDKISFSSYVIIISIPLNIALFISGLDIRYTWIRYKKYLLFSRIFCQNPPVIQRQCVEMQ